jgi:microcystin-dependent protein
LTHGFVRSPLRAAFFATSPAATMTEGFEVFVHEVMAAMTTDNAGNGSAFDIRGPRLTVNFCIALQGIFPSPS